MPAQSYTTHKPSHTRMAVYFKHMPIGTPCFYTSCGIPPRHWGSVQPPWVAEERSPNKAPFPYPISAFDSTALRNNTGIELNNVQMHMTNDCEKNNAASWSTCSHSRQNNLWVMLPSAYQIKQIQVCWHILARFLIYLFLTRVPQRLPQPYIVWSDPALKPCSQHAGWKSSCPH